MAFLQLKGPVTGEPMMVDAHEVVAVTPAYTQEEGGSPATSGTHLIVAGGDAFICDDTHLDVMAAIERITGRPIVPVKLS